MVESAGERRKRVMKAFIVAVVIVYLSSEVEVVVVVVVTMPLARKRGLLETGSGE